MVIFTSHGTTPEILLDLLTQMEKHPFSASLGLLFGLLIHLSSISQNNKRAFFVQKIEIALFHQN